MRIAGASLEVEFRGLSANLQGDLKLTDASDVPVRDAMGPRHANPGLGVALVAFAPRCHDRPTCTLLPPEGVLRPATAWIEPSMSWQDSDPFAAVRLVIGNPIAQPTTVVAGRDFHLAADTSAPYSRLLNSSKLSRLALWGLLWGHEVGRRAGVYLLDDYDAGKRPIIMIHGLGSSPVTWARLSNAILGDAELRRRYQIWHVVYQTNAPMLVNRRRIETYLDRAWQTLDPEGDDPARTRLVLVGHSMGGVLSRLLCASSGDSTCVARPEVLALSRLNRLSSVTTLGQVQPVTLAAHKLMPAAGIRYNTIAGNRLQQPEPGDGVVPLSSAILAGAESTLLVNSGHEVQLSDEAVQEVLRILHRDDNR